MDFIVEPLKFVGFDIVITVVDLVFKRTHFISIHMIVTTKNVTILFLYNI